MDYSILRSPPTIDRLGLYNSKYNRKHLVQEELPRIVNDLRPIVWVEKQGEGSSLCLTIRTRFASVERPMLHPNQILLPLQAQQLNRPGFNDYPMKRGIDHTMDACC